MILLPEGLHVDQPMIKTKEKNTLKRLKSGWNYWRFENEVYDNDSGFDYSKIKHITNHLYVISENLETFQTDLTNVFYQVGFDNIIAKLPQPIIKNRTKLSGSF